MNDLEILKTGGLLKKNICAEIEKVIVGQNDIISKIIISLLAQGHSLLVGVPGLAKTMIIKSIAQLLHLDFKRIQFTPDLMPSDITGVEVIDFNKDTNQRSFRFIKGPVFANIVLADEINRTSPKTQSALLEAMEEKTITVSGQRYELKKPFLVLATQNPIEQEGTYPLPEAQLDRFMFSLKLDYPNEIDEIEIVKLTTSLYENKINNIITEADLINIQQLTKKLPVSEDVVKYAVQLVRKTRPDDDLAPDFVKEYVEWGAGVRASQNLILGAKANAVLSGKESCSFDDIKYIVYETLRHRIIVNFHAQAQSITSDDIIKRLIE
jgi:MoxR-like ATPase